MICNQSTFFIDAAKLTHLQLDVALQASRSTATKDLIALFAKIVIGSCTALYTAPCIGEQIPTFPTSRNPSHAQLADVPITVSACCLGRFAKGFDWYLSVNSAGKGTITVYSRDGKILREIKVSKQQMQHLRNLIIEERFFQLDESYGKKVPGGNATMISITVGHFTKSVEINAIYFDVKTEDAAKLAEIRRLLTIRKLLRDWISEPLAVDLRKAYEQHMSSIEKVIKEQGYPSPKKTTSEDRQVEAD